MYTCENGMEKKEQGHRGAQTSKQKSESYLKHSIAHQNMYHNMND